MNQELHPKNYKRISVINWILTVPLIVLFGWPYLFMADFFHMDTTLAYIGAFLFATPFMLTILHGHVTMALGAAHRHLYYGWMEENSLTYGLLFHPMFISTRFRLILVVISLITLVSGWLLG